MTPAYRCPLCEQTLVFENKSWHCLNKHCFDVAKEGYVNLLPVQNKKSLEPGDSPAMMQSRRLFLQRGFYQRFAQRQFELIQQQLIRDARAINAVLDIGCGDGYYLMQLAEKLAPNQLDLHGIDIAKSAARLSAKQHKQAHFSVASAKNLPYFDNSFDLLLSIFSPLNIAEAERVLKPGGLLLIAGAGPEHLKQLAARVYKQAKNHEGAKLELGLSLELACEEQLKYSVELDGPALLELLTMTPYYWSADDSCKQALREMTATEIQLDFKFQLLKKP
ncbi:putative RNA methyltransferase [Agaribacterium haliotis]|uniref:putative RNA methyltransferase n=1 Tax=Agaribacterium haliotis TaxID=2013869 RepID=UPI000BB59EE7|nr:methyltransferase domain-containing protein [Agaribacterium haliotis]